jgi:hypothetical protein
LKNAISPSPQIAPTTRTSAEYGNKWAFTVDNGELDCIPNVPGERSGDVILKTDQGTYAINGSAMGKGIYKDLEEIWRDDPNNPGAKISVSDVIDSGLDICAAK